MSMISEQVKKLREYAESCNIYPLDKNRGLPKILNDSADTIESLSAKLQSANMEQTVDGCNNCIGWDSIHGGCTIHNTILGGCKDFCNIKHSLEDCVSKWIPCNEKLPENPFGCLVTVMDSRFNGKDFEEFENILSYHVGYSDGKWNDADGNQVPFEVIAWQPLPEPYRES